MIIVFVLTIVAVLTVFAALHWYVWLRTVRDTTLPGSALRRAGTIFIVAAPLLAFAALVNDLPGVPFAAEGIIDWPGYLWLPVFLYLVMGLAVGELVRPLLRRLLARRDARRAAPDPAAAVVAPASSAASSAAALSSGAASSSPGAASSGASSPAAASSGGADAAAEAAASAVSPDSSGAAADPAGPVEVPAAVLSRRLFVSRVVGGTAAAVALGTVGYGTYGVVRGPGVKRLTVPLARLPRSAHGFRIAVVSDVHLGTVLGRGFSQRVVDTINSTQPDLIAVVGDLVDGSVEDLADAVEPLAQLRARHGSFFVTGNHEYYSGAAEWVGKVRELGLQPLENARATLPGFDLAGVNDIGGEEQGLGPDYERALGDRDRSRATVLLAHQPVMIHDAVKYGVDLQLSGHTHGGQLWPGPLISEQVNPTNAGLESYGDTQLYVSRGAGAWGPPVRVGAPSDITVVELASKQA